MQLNFALLEKPEGSTHISALEALICSAGDSKIVFLHGNTESLLAEKSFIGYSLTFFTIAVSFVYD